MNLCCFKSQCCENCRKRDREIERVMRSEAIPLIARSRRLTKRNQIISVAGATIALCAMGTVMGFSSIAVSNLEGPDSDIRIDRDQLSWVASLVTLGCIFGSILGGYLADKIGRRRALMAAAVAFVIGWMAIALATRFYHLYLGRLLTGVSAGTFSTVVQVYICEIAEPSVRGTAGSIPTLMVTVGIVLVYSLGTAFDYHTVSVVCCFIPIFVFIYMAFVPETPIWLVLHQRIPEALEVLAWLRNRSLLHVSTELRRMQEHEFRRRESRVSLRAFVFHLFEGSVLKPFLICCSLFFFQQFSGIYSITFYMVSIFKAAGDTMNEYLATVIVGLVRVMATLVASLLINFFGRRPLLMVSAIVMAVSNTVFGSFFFVKDYLGIDPVKGGLGWLPLVCLICFMIGYSIGFGPVPWFLMPELLPADVRSIACGICICVTQMYLFFVVKVFYQMLSTMQTYGTFWFYAFCCCLGVVFVDICVPETRDKNLEEIEDMFKSTTGEGSSLYCAEEDEKPSTSADRLDTRI